MFQTKSIRKEKKNIQIKTDTKYVGLIFCPKQEKVKIMAKRKKELEPLKNFLDVVFNPKGKLIRKGKKYFWER